jgi:uncharacterized protein YjbI with pentapeptide repeats
VIDEMLFDLLGLKRAVESYRQKLVRQVGAFVDPPLMIEGSEGMNHQLRGSSTAASLWVLLAPGGWGKTSFCRKMALELSMDTSARKLRDAPFPIFVEFTRELEALPLDDLLVRFCREHKLDANRSGGLAYLLRKGRAILIVDGFDELASTFGLDKARLALERVLSEACAELGRAVVSSRTQFYELVSRGTILGQTLGATVQERYAELAPPDSMKIVRARVARRLTEDETQELEKHFARLPSELGSSPLAAAWTADELSESGVGALERIRSAVDFYEWYIRRLAAREEAKRLARVSDERGEHVMSVDEQIAWLERVAKYMLEYGGFEVSAGSPEDLSELMAALLDEAVPTLTLKTGQEELLSHAALASDRVAHELVVRLIHPSLREFLIARIATSDSASLDLSDVQRPTPELAQFLGEYLWEQKLDRGRFISLTTDTPNPQLWQSLIVFAGLDSPTLESATALERRHALESAVGIGFDQLDLTDVRIQRVDLSDASFRGTTLRHTIFTDCNLAGVRFDRAHLEDVEFLGCSLRNANFDDAMFVSGYVSESGDRGIRLTGDELIGALLEASAEQESLTEPKEVQGKTAGWNWGQLVGAALRAFVTRGGQVRRARRRETILRSRERRYIVQTQVIPVLMKERIAVLARGRPIAGNETLLLDDASTVKAWFESPSTDDQTLQEILGALLRRNPGTEEMEEFVAALKQS